jgi:hypothetical protein
MSCLFNYFQCEEIMKNETNLITSDRIDTLGALLADIKVLTAKADAIKDDLKDSANLSGDRTFEGDAFKALYIESNVSTVDWKRLPKNSASRLMSSPSTPRPALVLASKSKPSKETEHEKALQKYRLRNLRFRG